MHQYLAVYIFQLLFYMNATALNLPPDLNAAIIQSAARLNNTNIPVADNTQNATSDYDTANGYTAPQFNHTISILLSNNTLLKDTNVYCNSGNYGTVTYSSCSNALETLNIQRSKVYTIGNRETGEYDFSLPFRLMSSISSYFSYYHNSPSSGLP